MNWQFRSIVLIKQINKSHCWTDRWDSTTNGILDSQLSLWKTIIEAGRIWLRALLCCELASGLSIVHTISEHLYVKFQTISISIVTYTIYIRKIYIFTYSFKLEAPQKKINMTFNFGIFTGRALKVLSREYERNKWFIVYVSCYLSRFSCYLNSLSTIVHWYAMFNGLLSFFELKIRQLLILRILFRRPFQWNNF